MIVVPKDKYSEELLNYDQAADNQLNILKLQEPFFHILWEKGIFSNINEICNVNIDDFEDERITNIDNIRSTIKYLENKKASFNKDDQMNIELIIDIFKLALSKNVGVYFYF